jgi:hypothetical protein
MTGEQPLTVHVVTISESRRAAHDRAWRCIALLPQRCEGQKTGSCALYIRGRLLVRVHPQRLVAYGKPYPRSSRCRARRVVPRARRKVGRTRALCEPAPQV